MSYSFLLNSISIEEPSNWSEAKIEVSRSQELPGLFLSFIADLEFTGNGYKMLKEAYDNGDGCDILPIEITQQCPGGFLFKGKINISEVSFNLQKCTARANIEEDTLAALINRLKSVSVQINGGKTLNGLALSDIGEDLASDPSLGSKKWFKIGDLMQYCLDYITDSSVSIDSDFLFLDEYSPNRFVVQVTSNGVPGTINIEWETLYGGTNSATQAVIALSSNNLAETCANAIVGSVGRFNGNTNEINGEYPIYAESFLQDIDVIFFGDQQFTDFDLGAAGSAIITQTETHSYGANNIYLTTGSILKDEIEDFFISFEELFTSFSGFMNLGMRPYEVGGNQFVQIEHEPVFFENAALFSITNPKDVILEKQDIYSFGSLNYVGGNEDTVTYLHQTVSYVGQSCSGNDLQARSTFKIPTPNFTTSVSTLSNRDIMYCEKWSPGGLDSIRIYPTRAVTGVSRVPVSGFMYAASAIHPLVAKNYSNRAPGGLTINGLTIQNNNNPKLKSLISFEYPLTQNQIQLIRDNPQRYILVDGVKAWISDIEINIKTGMSSFNLLIE